jgi:hypothetical protein
MKGGCDHRSMDEVLNRDLKLAGIHTGNVIGIFPKEGE